MPGAPVQSTPDRKWLMDIGCSHDLVGRRDVMPQQRRSRGPEKLVRFCTANREVHANTCFSGKAGTDVYGHSPCGNVGPDLVAPPSRSLTRCGCATSRFPHLPSALPNLGLAPSPLPHRGGGGSTRPPTSSWVPNSRTSTRRRIPKEPSLLSFLELVLLGHLDCAEPPGRFMVHKCDSSMIVGTHICARLFQVRKGLYIHGLTAGRSCQHPHCNIAGPRCPRTGRTRRFGGPALDGSVLARLAGAPSGRALVSALLRVWVRSACARAPRAASARARPAM